MFDLLENFIKNGSKMFDYKTVSSSDFVVSADAVGISMLNKLASLSTDQLREVRARTNGNPLEKYLFDKSHELILQKAEDFVLGKLRETLQKDKELAENLLELEIFYDVEKLGKILRDLVLDLY